MPYKHDKDKTSGYGKSGGSMGAGRSGKEDMGSEKPSDDSRAGSHKPDGNDENQVHSSDDTDNPKGGDKQ